MTLPLEVAYGMPQNEACSSPADYLQTLQARVAGGHLQAWKALNRVAERQKHYYNADRKEVAWGEGEPETAPSP